MVYVNVSFEISFDVLIHSFNASIYLKVVYYIKFIIYVREFIEFYLKLICLIRPFIINDVIKLFIFSYKVLKEDYYISFDFYGFYYN